MDDSLQALLDKATNPKNRYEDWEFIMAFCDKVNAEPEGPQTALQIISPKMKDKNEKVAMLALALLEACVKNCGRNFHQELGKFRFLNEMIRMISPKYLGNETPDAVRKKIQELLYSWKVGLPNEPKIAEAYEMLKKQGLIFDESTPRDHTLDSMPAKPKVSLKEDPRQAQMLGKLVKSRNPEDLRAANRLIRDMVRRDDKRMEKLKKRLEDLDLINNNIKLLNEMLSHYKEDSAEHEKTIIEELYSSVEKMRPQLFKMASELQSNEEGMSEILQANDSVIRVMAYFQRVMGTSPTHKNEKPKEQNSTVNDKSQVTGGDTEESTGDLLLDLSDLNFDTPVTPVTQVTQVINNGPQTSIGVITPTTGLLDNFSLLDVPPGIPSIPPLNLSEMNFPISTQPVPVTGQTGLSDVNLIGGNIPIIAPVPSFQPTPPPPPPPPGDAFAILANLTVPLESLKPSSKPPLQVMNKNGITISLHCIENQPAPDITAMIISVISTNPKPISNVVFQSAVPKVMKVKLQPPTNTELSGFNPILPPSNISQVMLLANPSKAAIRLKYRVSYTPHGEVEVVEMGELSNFP